MSILVLTKIDLPLHSRVVLGIKLGGDNIKLLNYPPTSPLTANINVMYIQSFHPFIFKNGIE